MPRGDQTGPAGMGPRTGRGMGFCNGFDAPGFMNSGFGRGFGRGMGRGRGFGRRMRWRRMASAPVQDTRVERYEPVAQPVQLSKEEEKKILEAELKEIDVEKKEIEKRIKELK
jgi:hypothetical protein